MLSATDLQSLATLIGVMVTLVASITALIKTVQGNAVVKQVKANTDGTLAVLTAKKENAVALQATAVELAARPPMPTPAEASPSLRLLPGPPRAARGG